MTGFIWVVFDPPGSNTPSTPQAPLLTPGTSFDESQQSFTLPSTPPRRRTNPSSSTPRSSPLKPGTPSKPLQHTPLSQGSDAARVGRKQKKRDLKGCIQARQPRAKTHAKNYLPEIPTSTAYYTWPSEGRGARIVNEADYKRSVELLLRLDFANLGIAEGSTKRWISEVGGGMRWGWDAVGRKPMSSVNLAAPVSRAQVNNMTNLVRKKRAVEPELDRQPVSGHDEPSLFEDATGSQSREATCSTLPQAIRMSGSNVEGSNILGTNMVRKKRKGHEEGGNSLVVDQVAAPEVAASTGSLVNPSSRQVNVLGTGLVRKKPKAL